MNHNDPFQHLVTRLLRHMCIELAPNRRNRVYTLTFDDETEVHLLSACAGKLDMVAGAGTLGADRIGDSAAALLAMNSFHEGSLPLNIGIDGKSGLVSLWLQHSLTVLDLDGAMSMLDHMLDGVAAVRGLLAPACPVPVRAAFTTANILYARGTLSLPRN